MATLTFETLINLSADEFTKLALNTNGITDKDMLLMITRFENEVLEKIKTKDGDKHERYIFYKRILDMMYAALQAEDNVNFWKNVAVRAKMGEEFHKENAAIYYNELIKYKAIEEVINTGKLDDYIKQVKERNKK